MTETLREILSKAGVSPLPSDYSGRGANLSDLDPDKLDRIHDAIENAFGTTAGKAFIQLVQSIQVLSATDFIISVTNLEANEWKFEGKVLSSHSGVYADSAISALATMAESFSGKKRDSTAEIRGAFLRAHRAAIPDADLRVNHDEDKYWYLKHNFIK